jgi:hypothetical protein
MSRRPPVDGRAPSAGVLRHVRPNVLGAQFLDEVGCVVCLFGAQRD